MRNRTSPAGDEPTEEGTAAPEMPPLAVTEEAQPAAPVPSEPALEEPLTWAKKLGKFGKDPKFSVNKKPRQAAPSWDHAAADQIHGWSLHAQHSATPLRITKEAYLAALVAAGEPDLSLIHI
jgi:hypothetical protein